MMSHKFTETLVSCLLAVKLLHRCDVQNEKIANLVIGRLGITSSFVLGMVVGRGGRAPWTPWILKLLATNVVFLISRGKNQISPVLVPPGKNPSDVHGAGQIVGIPVCTRGFLVVSQSRRVY